MAQYTRDRSETDASLGERHPGRGEDRDVRATCRASGALRVYRDSRGNPIHTVAVGFSPGGGEPAERREPGAAQASHTLDPLGEASGEPSGAHAATGEPVDLDPAGPAPGRRARDPYGPPYDPDFVVDARGERRMRGIFNRRFHTTTGYKRTDAQRERDTNRRAADRCAEYLARHYVAFEAADERRGFTLETLTAPHEADPEDVARAFEQLNDATRAAFPIVREGGKRQAWTAVWRRDHHESGAIHYHVPHAAFGYDLRLVVWFRRRWWNAYWERKLGPGALDPEHGYDSGRHMLGDGLIPYMSKVGQSGHAAGSASAEAHDRTEPRGSAKPKTSGAVNREVLSMFECEPDLVMLDPETVERRCIEVAEAMRQGVAPAASFVDMETGQLYATVRMKHCGHAANYMDTGDRAHLEAIRTGREQREQRKRTGPGRALADMVRERQGDSYHSLLGLCVDTNAEEADGASRRGGSRGGFERWPDGCGPPFGDP